MQNPRSFVLAVIEERNQLKHELNDVQCERDELFEDKVHLNSLLQELSAEKSRSLQRIDWLSSRCSQYEAIARNLKEQNEVLNERVGHVIVMWL